MPRYSNDKDEAYSFKESIEKRKKSNDWEYLLEVQLLHLTEAIVRAMEEGCLSRAELARKLGVSRANISRLLNNSHNIQLDTLFKVSAAVGLKPRIEVTSDKAEFVSECFRTYISLRDWTFVGSTEQEPEHKYECHQQSFNLLLKRKAQILTGKKSLTFSGETWGKI